MPRQFKPRRDLNLDRMFETRSEAWEAAGLSVGFNERVVKRARVQAIVLLPLFIAILVFWSHHWEILSHISYIKHHIYRYHHGHRHRAKDYGPWNTGLLIVTIVSLVLVGWKLAGALGKL